MEARNCLLAFDIEEFRSPVAYFFLDLFELWALGGDLFIHLCREIVPDRIGQDEIPVGESLHQGACTEAVSARSEKLASPSTWSPGRLLIRL